MRTSAFLERRAGLILAIAVAVTALLAVPFLAMAPTETASQEPDGPEFAARDLIDERFVSNVYPVPVIVESPDGNMLTRSALMALLEGENALRDNAGLAPGLVRYFDADAGIEVHGVLSIADLVDRRLPQGLAAATDAETEEAIRGLIDEYGPAADLLGLSVETTFDAAGGRWVAPAVFTQVLGDNDVLGLGNLSVTLGGDTAGEEWARRVVDTLGGETDTITALGVAIDVNLTSEEQGQAAGPFIGFTILAVLVIVGLTFRSYWVLAVTGAALGALIVWLKGISNLIGLEDDLILSLVVPIAMVSFGVDFVFHSVGRYREERRTGVAPRRAFVVGVASVAGALGLALASDSAAFLANTSSGIPSIVQFGVGAAIALAAAFLLLGIVTPLAVAVIESRVPAPAHGVRRAFVRTGAAVAAAATLMAAVLLMVYVLPVVGVAALGLYLGAFVVVPVLTARRPGAAEPVPTAAGAGGGSARVGRFIARTAAARVVMLPLAVVVTGLAALAAVRVPTEFDVKDFFSADTGFVRSLDALDRHVADRGGEPAQIYVEADLTDPAVVARVVEFSDELRGLGADGFGRDENGAIRVERGVGDVLDAVWSSPAALPAIEAGTGISITDRNGDRVPDDPTQLNALWQFTRHSGIPLDADRLVRSPGDVRTAVWIAADGTASATVFELALTDTRGQGAIAAARDALAGPIAGLRADLGGDTEVALTGSPIVRQASLEAISTALQVSLPIAVVLVLAIASFVMRSLRMGIVTVVPILMVVAWLYAVMEVFGFAINLVTATIGAVSLGIGIDFAVHFAMRYREELRATGSRQKAVQIAGEGTGTALIASALSSIVGFGIMALAPMPLFASYGLLTAVMILMALAASLLVLPGMLMLVTADAPEPVAARIPGHAQPEPARA
jgi:predicted RND superfamily exporter protein